MKTQRMGVSAGVCGVGEDPGPLSVPGPGLLNSVPRHAGAPMFCAPIKPKDEAATTAALGPESEGKV